MKIFWHYSCNDKRAESLTVRKDGDAPRKMNSEKARKSLIIDE
jgi:hypothetical protein